MQPDQPLLSDSDSLPELVEMLKFMATKLASDIFISVGAPVKVKIHGEQYPLTSKIVTKDDVEMLLTGSMNTSQLEELERDRELNIAISVPRHGRFRVSAFVQRNTKAMVVRYIPPEVPKFETLGLPEVLRALVMQKRGLMLMVGPTGSGKTTTLAALINHRNEHRSDHIITIEDPIEFLFRHKKSIVNQRELGTDARSYHEALRNALRQAPDVIMIGEIRDKESMSMAMQYAQSGHLCLATLHANNSYHALNRIVGFYPPDMRDSLFPDLASSLRAIVSQRLVPSLNGKRAAAVEVLINTRSISEMIDKGQIDQIPEIMAKQNTEGTITFEDILLEMVENKVISVDNALVYSDSPTNLFWRMAQKGLKIDMDAANFAGVDREQISEYKTEHPDTANENEARGPDANIFAGIRINADAI
jgi:twitching motility protein PilU